jgi:hypothetical protein
MGNMAKITTTISSNLEGRFAGCERSSHFSQPYFVRRPGFGD